MPGTCPNVRGTGGAENKAGKNAGPSGAHIYKWRQKTKRRDSLEGPELWAENEPEAWEGSPVGAGKARDVRKAVSGGLWGVRVDASQREEARAHGGQPAQAPWRPDI